MEANDEKKANRLIVLIGLLIFIFLILMGFSTYNLAFKWPYFNENTTSDDINECEPSDSNRYDHNSEFWMDALSWSPKSKYLAACSGIDGFIIYDTESWEKVYQNDRRYLSPSSFSWKSDESLLAVGSEIFGICFYNTSTWKPIKHLDNNDIIQMIAFSPDDSMLALANFNGEINIRDTKNWKLIISFKAHEDHINQIDWSPDSSMLASTSRDNKVKIWDASNWNLINEFTNLSARPDGVSWSHDGSKLAVGALGTLYIWNSADWTDKLVFEEEYLVNYIVKYNNDGKMLAFNDFDNIGIYDTATWELIHNISINDISPKFSFDWCTIDDRYAFASNNKSISIWKFDEMSNSFILEKDLEFKFD